MQTLVKQPLTNLQLELLNVFAREVDEKDLIEIKRFLINYFATKAMDMADSVWDKNQWTEKDEHRFLNEHSRTPYKRKKS